MNVVDLPGLYFVYTFDENAPAKQQQARTIIAHALSSKRGVIGTQVIQEFLNVALHKFVQPMSRAEARTYLRQVLLPTR